MYLTVALHVFDCINSGGKNPMYTDDVEASKIPESNMIHLPPHDCMCMMHIGNWSPITASQTVNHCSQMWSKKLHKKNSHLHVC